MRRRAQNIPKTDDDMLSKPLVCISLAYFWTNAKVSQQQTKLSLGT